MKSQFTGKRLKKFLSYYRPHRVIFTVDMFFAALNAVAVLLFPLISGYIVNEVLTGWNEEVQRRLMTAGCLLFLLMAVQIASSIFYAYFGHAMAAKMERSMREELFCHYESQSFSFHARNSVGKLMTVISNDLMEMTELFHHGPENILMLSIKFIGAFVILFQIDLPLTLIMFTVFPLLCLLSVKTDRLMETALIQNKQDLSQMNEHLEDVLSGIRTVKAFGSEETEGARFRSRSKTYTDSKCRFYKVEAYFYETVESYPQFLTMLTIFFGSLLIGKGQLDIPVLVTFLLYVGSLAEPVQTMLNFMKLYEVGKAGFIRFMDMMEITPSVAESSTPVEPGNIKGEITFDNVSFHYEDSEENVLEHISLHVPGGQSIAFAGASGIGKTTISALIARFYDVTEGRILLDGIDIRDISNKALRANIGIVQQEVYIFNGTIKDNIRYGSPNASDKEVEQAARLANIHDFICSLEHGYDSIVGTRGIMLSGGQRQRISIARLFLKNPRILILDEATSALDYESEVAVQKSIEKLMEGRTSILIAHRLSTIKNVDKIFVLANKQIAEQGTHGELFEKGGEYAKLCRLGGL